MNVSNKNMPAMVAAGVKPVAYDIVASILRFRPQEVRATLAELRKTRPDLFEAK